MLFRRRKSAARREPRLGRPGSVLDLRLSPGDRPAPAPSAYPRRKQADPPARAGASVQPATRRRAKPVRRRGRLARAAYWCAVLALWSVIAALAGVIYIGAHLPPVQSLAVPKRPPSIKIAALDGRILVTRGDSGMSTRIEDLPRHVPQAFIAIEDRRFYDHYGVDPRGIARAFFANIAQRAVSQGGSTLSQQLAKNLFLTQERTLSRKLQELVLALWLERKFSKNEILELYLNRIYFGAGAYGIEAAAKRYFAKRARDLSLAEAAMLAGVVRSPSRLAPTRNLHGAERRAHAVIAAMKEQGFIDEKTARIALAQPGRPVKQNSGGGAVNYVADWIMDALDDLVGFVEEDIVVQTSLDPLLQAAAEQAISDELAARGDRSGVTQGAFVAMSPDGAVRAMVGGRNYTESQFNRAVAARRQPGSAFKPFVYLTAIERGLIPETVREDKPVAVKGWKPENYTREYHGLVTLTQALALSLNTVSVRLTLEFGPTAVTRTAYRLGISSKLEPNASLALGTSEVSLIELVSAYAPFANGGTAVIPHVVESARTADGKLLYQRSPAMLGPVIEPRYVGMMNAMMQETLLTGTGRRADIGYPAAGKTGTSQDFRDGWFIGYTSHLVSGVWFGNDDNSPTRKMAGSGLPAETWARIMKVAHRGLPVAALPGAPGRTFFSLPGFSRQQPSGLPQTQSPQAEIQVPSNRQNLDRWLIDGLFGRR